MSLVVIENLTKNYAVKDVLRGVSAVLAPDERVGLVGSNGCGKTTLMRIIAGLDSPTDGACRRANGLRLGYLPQEPPASDGLTLRQSLEEVFEPIRQLERDLHDLTHSMEQGDHSEAALRRLGRLQQEFETAGGYGYEQRIPRILEGLHFAPDMWDRPLAQLSGGQRTRGHLARLLLERPDVLLLDEPTNHLDLDSVEWLEEWLTSFKGALIVISHDRYFLDHVTNVTWELSYGLLESYRGGYSEYLPKRQQRYEERLKQWNAQQQYIEKTEDFYRRYGAAERVAQARGRLTGCGGFCATRASTARSRKRASMSAFPPTTAPATS